jgi:uncharacterized membrane protein
MVAKVMALVGVYSIILAGLAMRFSGQKNTGSFNLTMIELGAVTLVFIVIAVVMVTRPARQPKEPLE